MLFRPEGPGYNSPGHSFGRNDPKRRPGVKDAEEKPSARSRYSSNLKNLIDFAVKICQNPFVLWDSSDLSSKRVFQNLLFPEGIYYNHELDLVRTSKINTFFSPIPELARVLSGQKKGDSIKLDKIPALVIPTGFEPISKEPESFILSIELGDRLYSASTKIIIPEFIELLSFKNINFLSTHEYSPDNQMQYDQWFVNNFICPIIP